jgi:hypothetical protein
MLVPFKATASQRICSALLMAFCFGSSAQASFVLNVVQTGSNVVASGTGTLNTAALTNSGSSNTGGSVWPSVGLIVVGPTARSRCLPAFPGRSLLDPVDRRTRPPVQGRSLVSSATPKLQACTRRMDTFPSRLCQGPRPGTIKQWPVWDSRPGRMCTPGDPEPQPIPLPSTSSDRRLRPRLPQPQLRLPSIWWR